MAINKAQTSLGTKIVLIIVIVAFVGAFIPLIPSFFSQQQSLNQQQGTTQGSADAINQQYGPAADALQAAVASDPTSYTALVNLGNTYVDWAGSLQQASQNTTSTARADGPVWISAKVTFEKALKLKKGDPEVEGNYAVALFNTGDPTGAIKAMNGVVKANPKFAPGWFNLGIFYRATGDNANAIKAYETYLKVDPQNQLGNADAAKSAVAELKAAK